MFFFQDKDIGTPPSFPVGISPGRSCQLHRDVDQEEGAKHLKVTQALVVSVG